MSCVTSSIEFIDDILLAILFHTTYNYQMTFLLYSVDYWILHCLVLKNLLKRDYTYIKIGKK